MKTLLLMMTFLVIGCGSKNSSNSSIPAPQDEISAPASEPEILSYHFDMKLRRKTDLNPDLSNKEEFKRDINTYEVEFQSKSKAFSGSEVICFKTNFDQSIQKRKTFFDEQGKWATLTLTLTHSDPQLTEYECKVEGAEENVTIKLKKSLVIEGKKSAITVLGSFVQYKTVFIEKDAELITEGADLDLEIEELYSLNGSISTFSEEKQKEKTLEVQTGLSGGHIHLKVKRAVGSLKIHLRGLNGGDNTKLHPVLPPQVSPTSLHGGCSSYNPSYTGNCVGKNGLDGVNGKDGEVGGQGGSSGRLTFTGDLKELKLELNYQPGLGGNGSKGQEGSAGEPGGKGVHVTWREHQTAPQYRQFPNGTNGKNGIRGKDGAQGETGSYEESNINEEVISGSWINL